MPNNAENYAVLVIPLPPPPSLNRQERMHWAVRRRLRERWKTAARLAWHHAGRPRFHRPTITVRFYYRNRRPRDPDNAAAAVKPILDGLKGAAWDGDDDAGTITLAPVELHVDRQSPRVEVEICEGAVTVA